MSPILPVILCGGSGTRLWPESRRASPKQFLALLGKESLFQQTLARAQAIAPQQKPFVLANEAMRFLVFEDMEKSGIEADILLEPGARDTAASVASAALSAAKIDPQTVAVILPSDHFITPQDVFLEDVSRAVQAARAGSIVVFGAVPSAPSTAYGYIAPGDELPDAAGLRRVAGFHEKPDTQTAAALISAGHLWNSGIFVARADVLIDAFEMHAPLILEAAKQALGKAQGGSGCLKLDAQEFTKAEKLPFDIAVMEKTLNAAVLPARFAWSDIGAWDAVWEIAPKDEAGNAVYGNVLLQDTKNSLVRSSKNLVAVLGLEDMAVIATPDAVLVAPKNRMQDVRRLVARLESERRVETIEHGLAHRPWGHYETKDLGEGYRVKRITVKPGGRLSLQKHAHRAEHWVVVKGVARVTIGDIVQTLQENQSAHIPLGAVHRLENPGSEPLELIEVQCGSYLEEDDIVRLDDVYGRAEKKIKAGKK